MTREIEFEQSLVDGGTMRSLVAMIPFLEHQFSQRKTYDEYYFNSFDYTFSVQELEQVTNSYRVTLDSSTLIIHND